MTMNPWADFRKACRTDYIDLLDERGEKWLLADAAECEEAATYFATEPGQEHLAVRAQMRAEEAFAVAKMPADLVHRKAKAIRSQRGQNARDREERKPGHRRRIVRPHRRKEGA